MFLMAWVYLIQTGCRLGVLWKVLGGLHTGKLNAMTPSKMQQENQSRTK